MRAKSVRAIDRQTTIRVAGMVPCDPRSVDRYFAGRGRSYSVTNGIRVALAALGIPDPRVAQAPATEAQ